MSRRSSRKPARTAMTLAGSLVLGLAASQYAAAPAAAEECELEINFSAPALSIEYGEYWEFMFTANQELGSASYPDEIVVSATNVPSGYVPSYYYSASTGYAVPGYLSGNWEAAPLAPGSYSFSIATSFSDDYTPCDSYTGQTPTPATLTVVPAALGIELRALADASNPRGAIVTAQFTGRMIDGGYYSPLASPTGVWHFVVRDESGAPALERAIERSTSDALSTSFYWPDAEPGETYTVTASFEPSASTAGNYAIATSNEVSYTALADSRAVPTSTATGQPDSSLPAATGFALPLWLIVLVAILLVGLATLVTMFSVRLQRRARALRGPETDSSPTSP